MQTEQLHRPWRSLLYVPASSRRALDKARTLPADGFIFDLEDAVAPEAKAGARETLRGALERGGFGDRACLVRINGLDTPWGADDARAFREARIDGLLIPKVNGPADLDAVLELCDRHPLWAMVETARGVLAAAEIAGHTELAGFVLGTNDLARELGCRAGAGRVPLQTALQHALLAARAAGIICIDGVYNAFRDEAGLRAECVQGRDFGFDGKTLIHPAQLAAANELFAPSEEEVALARRQIAAFEEAEAAGRGVAVVDGRIVENLHVADARATLAKAEAITQRESEWER